MPFSPPRREDYVLFSLCRDEKRSAQAHCTKERHPRGKPTVFLLGNTFPWRALADSRPHSSRARFGRSRQMRCPLCACPKTNGGLIERRRCPSPRSVCRCCECQPFGYLQRLGEAQERVPRPRLPPRLRVWVSVAYFPRRSPFCGAKGWALVRGGVSQGEDRGSSP